jgi:hypothetical protein
MYSPGICPELLSKTATGFSIAGLLTEIRTDYLPNTNTNIIGLKVDNSKSFVTKHNIHIQNMDP